MAGISNYGTAQNNEMSTQINEESLSDASTIEETFQVIKNVSGQFWSPQFSQLNTLTPGEGYMMYVITDNPPAISFNAQFQMPQISGCTNCSAENFRPIATVDDGSCLILGCTDSESINYNELATLDNGSCDVNLSIAVGDLAEGGIVFYVDETGEHGLVAAMEDIEGTYEWGCYETHLAGADGQAIGTGYQNTLDIVSGCSETPIAASEALAYESEGYSDWYLPSKDELYEMYSTIGNEGLEGNIGGFDTSDWPYYWSSSESSSDGAWNVNFSYGGTGNYSKNDTGRVRVIRAF